MNRLLTLILLFGVTGGTSTRAETGAADPSALARDSIEATALTRDSIEATALTRDSIEATALTRDSIEATALTRDSIEATALTRGKAIAFDRNAGNCLSCHMMDDGELPGNSGPPLIQMQVRFPDRAVLRQQVWDAAIRNPETVMPPYGRNLVLSEEEIDLVVDYVLSL